MADSVYDSATITIGEGEDAYDVLIKTNTIARQRRFMAQWDNNGVEVEKKREQYDAAVKEAEAKGEEFDEDFEVDPYDGYVALCGISLEKVLDGKIEGKLYTSNRKLTSEYKEYIEENLDFETIKEVIRVCGGINLDAMMEAIQEIQSETPVAESSGQI